jgi:ABC-2 type transport system permease protein
MSLSRCVALMWKELLEFRRDRVVVLFILYAFTVDLLADAGHRMALHNAGLGVLDQDRSAASRELVGRFPEPYFRHGPAPRDADEIVRGLDSGDDMVGVVVPSGFEAELARGERASIQLLLDGSQAIQAALAEAYAREIVAGLSRQITLRRLGLAPDAVRALPIIEPALRVRFNPDRNDLFFMLLNSLGMMMSLVAILLSASALIRERERGTLEQLLVSPLEPWEILLAKTVASTVILLAGAAVGVFGVLFPIFHVPVRGSLVVFFGCATIFAFAMCGLGMTVASLCRTMPQVGMVTLLVMTPLLFVSGGWTPVEAMPGWLAGVTLLSPLRWFTDISYGLFLRGATLSDLVLPIAAMTGLGTVFFVWGALRFRARFR